MLNTCLLTSARLPCMLNSTPLLHGLTVCAGQYLRQCLELACEIFYACQVATKFDTFI
jgi:hypothetical protein